MNKEEIIFERRRLGKLKEKLRIIMDRVQLHCDCYDYELILLTDSQRRGKA